MTPCGFLRGPHPAAPVPAVDCAAASPIGVVVKAKEWVGAHAVVALADAVEDVAHEGEEGRSGRLLEEDDWRGAVVQSLQHRRARRQQRRIRIAEGLEAAEEEEAATEDTMEEERGA